MSARACGWVGGFIKKRMEEEEQSVSLVKPKFQLESRNANHKKEKKERKRDNHPSDIN